MYFAFLLPLLLEAELVYTGKTWNLHKTISMFLKLASDTADSSYRCLVNFESIYGVLLLDF